MDLWTIAVKLLKYRLYGVQPKKKIKQQILVQSNS